MHSLIEHVHRIPNFYTYNVCDRGGKGNQHKWVRYLSKAVAARALNVANALLSHCVKNETQLTAPDGCAYHIEVDADVGGLDAAFVPDDAVGFEIIWGTAWRPVKVDTHNELRARMVV